MGLNPINFMEFIILLITIPSILLTFFFLCLCLKRRFTKQPIKAHREIELEDRTETIRQPMDSSTHARTTNQANLTDLDYQNRLITVVDEYRPSSDAIIPNANTN